MSIALFLAAQLAATTPATLPAQFVGAWAEDLSMCGKEDANGVLIEPSAITFYEAHGAVRSARLSSGSVSATVEYSGEGRKWTETNLLRLGTDGKLSLMALGKTTTLHRCPLANRT